MKILVFGGAGYIGAHVVMELLDSNHSVVVFDNFSTGQIKNVDKRSIIYEGDILSKQNLKEVFNEHNFDAVMHFCALKAPAESMKNPVPYSDVNIIGTLNILKFMLKNNVEKFIFSSSSSIYGEPQTEFINEDHNLEPMSFYGFTKLETENILKWYSRITKLNFVSLRYFNAAGYDLKYRIQIPEKDSPNLIPRIMDVINGKDKYVKIFGSDYDTPDGTCIRDYIHVSDLANAHVKSLRYLNNNKTPICLNLATGFGHSVLDIIKRFESLSKVKFKYKFRDRRKGDPSMVVSKSKYKTSPIKWKPLYSDIDTIINSVLKMYKI